MKHDALRLSSRHRFVLYSTLGILFFSGALWLIFDRYIRSRGEFGETAHPLEPWWLKAHGVAAMVFLVILGTVLHGHVRRAWHRKVNRFSGALFLSLNGLLVLSGYALYYCGGETTRAAISRVHWLAGAGYPLVLVWHIWQGRRARRKPNTPRLPPPVKVTD